MCVVVGPSISSFSGTTGFDAAHERYQRLRNYASLKTKRAILLYKTKRHGRGDLCFCLFCVFVPFSFFGEQGRSRPFDHRSVTRRAPPKPLARLWNEAISRRQAQRR